MKDKSKNKLIDRELSWLEFNARVLSEGMDPSNSLAERLKFIEIVSANFDEFFMVRVSGLKEVQDPVLSQVRKKAHQIVKKQNHYFEKVLISELAKMGFLRVSDLKKYRSFLKQMLPSLVPINISENQPLVLLPNLKIYSLFSAKDGKEESFYAVELPNGLPRIIFLPSKKGRQFALLEDVVAFFIPELFFGRQLKHHGLLRLTRRADLALDEGNSEDFSKVMTAALRQRGEADIVRVETTKENKATKFLMTKFKVTEEEICSVSTYLDLKGISQAIRGALVQGSMISHCSPNSSPRDSQLGKDIWKVLKQKDVCLHHPYDSFDPVVRFVNSAATDTKVVEIKQVLYRTDLSSPFIEALVLAAQNGKIVTVLLELKARFNEENNIHWARRLKAAGAKILYGMAGLKTHAKVCLVTRKERGKLKDYVHLSTGNYNDRTAQIYSDLGLFSSNQALTKDIQAFFNVVSGSSHSMLFEKIEIAPHWLKHRFLKLIRREIIHSQNGRRGFIVAKMNALVDPEIIEALYLASSKGIQIKLNVRGACCLRPGVKGLSENIQVVSIVDTFLEHSRIFHFSNGGKDEIYLSSADWMQRNLERRLEILFPIECKIIKKSIIDLLQLYFKDNMKSWQLMPNGKYIKNESKKGAAFRVQTFLRDRALADNLNVVGK